MKRFFAAALAALTFLLASAALTSCVTDSFGMKYYETRDRMNGALEFEMRGIPDGTEGIVSETGYGAQDGELGQITYSVTTAGGRSALLTFRMASPDYAAKYSEHTGTPGIAGIGAGDPIKSEKLGTASVEYYANDGGVFAVWDFDGYAFSASLKFDGTADSGAASSSDAGYDDLYPFVLAFIAQRNGDQNG